MNHRVPLLVASLLLCACEEHVNLTEFDNLSAQTIADRARIAELTRQVGQPVADPMVASLAEQVAALRAENATLAAKMAMLQLVKVPHFIVADTGEDLGLYLGDPARTWDVVAQGEVDWRNDWTLYYESADCSGTAWGRADYFARDSSLIIGPPGMLYRRSPGLAVTPIVALSAFFDDPQLGPHCFPWQSMAEIIAVRVRDTGVPAHTYKAEQLTIGLR